MTRRSFRAKNMKEARKKISEFNASNKKNHPRAKTRLVATIKLSQKRKSGGNYYSVEISDK